MNSAKSFLLVSCALALTSVSVSSAAAGPGSRSNDARPNVILILFDDLGWGDLGVYGQTIREQNGWNAIRTPEIDRLAAAGMRFTDFYAGAPVCGPSRCTLLTGRHTGHGTIRKNFPTMTLAPGDLVFAEWMRDSGYATGVIGKWGMAQQSGPTNGTGFAEEPALPARKGFDEFFGYRHHRDAHDAYPDKLWESMHDQTTGRIVTHEISVAGFSGDLFAQRAEQFIERRADEPFFLYLSLTSPHANSAQERMDAPPELEDYTRKFPAPEQAYASTITRQDRQIGALMARLRELKLAERTLILITSDNGSHAEGHHSPDFFASNGDFRGFKRDLYEGGIRVPLIAVWPGTVPAGKTSAVPATFADIFPTMCELAGVPAPESLDGQSFLDELRGGATLPTDRPLYWEALEGASAPFTQAVRLGAWKGWRKGGQFELYNLAIDPGERTNLAEDPAHAALVQRLKQLMDTSHEPMRDAPP